MWRKWGIARKLKTAGTNLLAGRDFAGLRAIGGLRGVKRRILAHLGPRPFNTPEGIEVLPAVQFAQLLAHRERFDRSAAEPTTLMSRSVAPCFVWVRAGDGCGARGVVRKHGISAKSIAEQADEAVDNKLSLLEESEPEAKSK